MTKPQPLSQAEREQFAAARTRFPGAISQSYLDVASRGLMPQNAPDLAFSHLTQRVRGEADKHAYFEIAEMARRRFAALVGATEDEIALTKNISEGLNIVAGAIDWRAGDEVLLCSGVEHPNNIYVWRNLERRSVKVHDVASVDGLYPLDSVIELLARGGRTRVVAVSATSFAPGFRVDLRRLGAACKRAGVYLVVDGAQSAGITHVDLAETHVDALAVSAQKGLCSLYGMGFLYVRRAFAERLTPHHLARFGVAIDASHEADYDPGPVKYRAAARRFDLGNHNFLAALLVGDTLKLLNELGTSAIDRHVTQLASALSDGLQRLGVPIVVPANALQANMVCVRFPGNPEVAGQLQRHLQQRGVQVAMRRDMVRFSFHFYNDEPDVAAALDACGAWFGSQGVAMRR